MLSDCWGDDKTLRSPNPHFAIELIALEQWFELEDPILYGAVTTGDIWQFGSLNRQQILITQDTMLYRVPTDLGPLMDILVGILQG